MLRLRKLHDPQSMTGSPAAESVILLTVTHSDQYQYNSESRQGLRFTNMQGTPSEVRWLDHESERNPHFLGLEMLGLVTSATLWANGIEGSCNWHCSKTFHLYIYVVLLETGWHVVLLRNFSRERPQHCHLQTM